MCICMYVCMYVYIYIYIYMYIFNELYHIACCNSIYHSIQYYNSLQGPAQRLEEAAQGGFHLDVPRQS